MPREFRNHLQQVAVAFCIGQVPDEEHVKGRMVACRNMFELTEKSLINGIEQRPNTGSGHDAFKLPLEGLCLCEDQIAAAY